MRIPTIMALWVLAACNGGNCEDNCDGTGGSDLDGCDEVEQINGECDDTGTEPTATGSFTAPKVALPDGSFEDCVSNLDETFSVPSGTTETGIPVGEYDMTFGSLDLATEYSDWLGVHTSNDGSQWIAPSELASIAKDTTLAPEPPAVSRYIGGQTWTCNEAESDDEDTAQTTTVYYIDGAEDLLISIGGSEWGISGNTLYNPYSPEECAEMYGEFVSSTQLTYRAVCVEGDREHDTWCWEGEFENRPTDW